MILSLVLAAPLQQPPVIRGDATLFMRADQVEAAWRVVDPALDAWAASPPAEFPNYAAGTWGPAAADRLLARDGRAWAEPLPADREAIRLLRQLRGQDGSEPKPVIYLGNKSDSNDAALGANAYYELGVDHIMPVSALHGRGFGELEEALADALPALSGPTLDVDEDVPRVREPL